MTTFLIILIAILLDLTIGELPNKIHPVVLIGNMITFLKNHLTSNNRFTGMLIALITVFTTVIITGIILTIADLNIISSIIIGSIIFSTTFSIKFLITSVEKIQKDLSTNLDAARKSVSYLVSRDTKDLTEAEITSATIETLTENITDSIISPILYGFIFNIPFAMMFRVINTLDAMLGYKTKELINIGYFSARLDDVLNYIPARIAGLYVVFAAFCLRYDWKKSYKMLRRDARKTPSPNSGYPMAATAGALNIMLVKKDVYKLGDKRNKLTSKQISKAINITKVSTLLFIVTLYIINLLISLIILG
ncbi:MAG: cobalamin biosynthesis protein [Methanobacteriaceae archaeon]|nr:cobalamin biosynthesis protein [Methanobacteriaceae archaeon]